jgi:hypothetical protein
MRAAVWGRYGPWFGMTSGKEPANKPDNVLGRSLLEQLIMMAVSCAWGSRDAWACFCLWICVCQPPYCSRQQGKQPTAVVSSQSFPLFSWVQGSLMPGPGVMLGLYGLEGPNRQSSS